ncbi:HNH endonuclease [Rhodococcus artemisiae]|uniref:HNH endonuclease n=1 Tax=Rhodococcus artemisiae TaxID=714159 RepID=UPI0038B5F653
MPSNIHGTRAWRELSERLRHVLPPICHICSGTIDLTLDSKHRESWTLDHLKPACDYPDLALEPSNLKPAHRHCNAGKAARGDSVSQPAHNGVVCSRLWGLNPDIPDRTTKSLRWLLSGLPSQSPDAQLIRDELDRRHEPYILS